MDILIKGPGEVTVCLVDHTGKVMLRETLRVSGSDTVGARRPIELALMTHEGAVRVSPVLVSHGGTQTVTFGGKAPALFTRERCKEIGCTDKHAEAVARGEIQHLEPGTPAGSNLASLGRPPKRG